MNVAGHGKSCGRPWPPLKIDRRGGRGGHHRGCSRPVPGPRSFKCESYFGVVSRFRRNAFFAGRVSARVLAVKLPLIRVAVQDGGALLTCTDAVVVGRHHVSTRTPLGGFYEFRLRTRNTKHTHTGSRARQCCVGHKQLNRVCHGNFDPTHDHIRNHVRGHDSAVVTAVTWPRSTMNGP